jgi:hypothetical protein
MPVAADHPEVRTRVQLIAAASAGLLGIAGLAFALFTPLHTYQDCYTVVENGQQGFICHSSLRSMFNEAGFSALGGMLVPAYFFAVAGIAGVMNARTPTRKTRRILWLSSAALAVLTFTMMFSIGAFMLPATLLALYAAVLSRSAEKAPAGAAPAAESVPTSA